MKISKKKNNWNNNNYAPFLVRYLQVCEFSVSIVTFFGNPPQPYWLLVVMETLPKSQQEADAIFGNLDCVCDQLKLAWVASGFINNQREIISWFKNIFKFDLIIIWDSIILAITPFR